MYIVIIFNYVIGEKLCKLDLEMIDTTCKLEGNN